MSGTANHRGVRKGNGRSQVQQSNGSSPGVTAHFNGNSSGRPPSSPVLTAPASKQSSSPLPGKDLDAVHDVRSGQRAEILSDRARLSRFESPGRTVQQLGTAKKTGCDPNSLPPSQQSDCLRSKLQSKQYEEAAKWLQKSSYLSATYDIADLVKLVIDEKAFDLAGRWLREFRLHTNQQLVNLFISRLVSDKQFNLAVRYAKELIPYFGGEGWEEPLQSRVTTWTPHTLVQAMLRAKQYSVAMKYIDQFQLQTFFPYLDVVKAMVHEKQWNIAMNHVKIYHLEGQISTVSLMEQILRQKDWDSALRYLSSGDQALSEYYSRESIVQRMIDTHDFISASRYLKQFCLVPKTEGKSLSSLYRWQHRNLEIPARNQELLRSFVRQLIGSNEYYKAIKYAVKFGLSCEEEFDVDTLIGSAFEDGHEHVAEKYILIFGLQDHFKEQLEQLPQRRRDRLLQHRRRMHLKRRRYNCQSMKEARAYLRDGHATDEEETEIVVFQEDIVMSVTREIVVDNRSRNALSCAAGAETADEEVVWNLSSQPSIAQDTMPLDLGGRYSISPRRSASLEVHSGSVGMAGNPLVSAAAVRSLSLTPGPHVAVSKDTARDVPEAARIGLGSSPVIEDCSTFQGLHVAKGCEVTNEKDSGAKNQLFSFQRFAETVLRNQAEGTISQKLRPMPSHDQLNQRGLTSGTKPTHHDNEEQGTVRQVISGTRPKLVGMPMASRGSISDTTAKAVDLLSMFTKSGGQSRNESLAVHIDPITGLPVPTTVATGGNDANVGHYVPLQLNQDQRWQKFHNPPPPPNTRSYYAEFHQYSYNSR